MTISDLRMTAYTDRREDGNFFSTTITRDEETNFNNDNNNEHDNDNNKNNNDNNNDNDNDNNNERISRDQVILCLKVKMP